MNCTVSMFWMKSNTDGFIFSPYAAHEWCLLGDIALCIWDFFLGGPPHYALLSVCLWLDQTHYSLVARGMEPQTRVCMNFFVVLGRVGGHIAPPLPDIGIL